MYSRVQYIGDGTTKTFAIPFDYLKEDHIAVGVKAVGETEYTSVSFTFTSTAVIELTTAPANESNILISRDTPKENRLVNFSDNTFLTQEDMDLDSNQHFKVAQEAFDASTTAEANATEAKTKAETADTNASTALSTSNTAITNSAVAVTASSEALSQSGSAVTTATEAKTESSEAKSVSETAASDSATAKSDAASARTTAESANATAQSADTKAAESKVESAEAKALAAESKAESAIAKSAANTASVDAAGSVQQINAYIGLFNSVMSILSKDLNTLDDYGAWDAEDVVVEDYGAWDSTSVTAEDYGPLATSYMPLAVLPTGPFKVVSLSESEIDSAEVKATIITKTGAIVTCTYAGDLSRLQLPDGTIVDVPEGVDPLQFYSTNYAHLY